MARTELVGHRTKVAVVGAGAVGATLAYAYLLRGVAHEVVLYDLDAAKVEAEVLDLRHGLQFVPRAEVNGNDAGLPVDQDRRRAGTVRGGPITSPLP